jgi:hypothetical protein
VIEPSPGFEQDTSRAQDSPISSYRSLFGDQLRIWQEEAVTCYIRRCTTTPVLAESVWRKSHTYQQA